MESPTTRVVIVGGGTSGWVTASLLKKHHGDSVKVQLIEAEEIPTIGVGEATVPSLIDILKDLEIDEKTFLQRCHGSFKLAIKFVNWRQSVGKEPSVYYHPFGHMPKIGTFDISQYWLRRWQLGVREGFARSCSMIPILCDHNKAPKDEDSEDYEGVVEYAYHIDAGLLGNFLREYAMHLGVQRLVGKVLSVELDGDGSIDHLKTDQHGELRGDLFIDCSGFRGLLLTQALKEPFISYTRSLFNDRAIALSVPREKDNTFYNNYTTSYALKNGWAWNIPLLERDGTGYVYSSHHTDPDLAEKEFRNFLGLKAQDLSAKHIKIRTGRHERAWVKNCVAIGLSGGFVEPLESSGIAFIFTTARNILPLIHKFRQDSPGVQQFNDFIGNLYDLIRDFLIIHYCTTDRKDTSYWLDCQKKIFIPEKLLSKLKQWKKRLPEEEENINLVSFNNFNVICVLMGMGFITENCKQGVDIMKKEQIEPIFEKIKKKALLFANHLPNHGNYLKFLQNAKS